MLAAVYVTVYNGQKIWGKLNKHNHRSCWAQGSSSLNPGPLVILYCIQGIRIHYELFFVYEQIYSRIYLTCLRNWQYKWKPFCKTQNYSWQLELLGHLKHLSPRYNQVLHILEQLLYFLISQFWTTKWEFNILPHVKGFLNAMHWESYCSSTEKVDTSLLQNYMFLPGSVELGLPALTVRLFSFLAEDKH